MQNTVFPVTGGKFKAGVPLGWGQGRINPATAGGVPPAGCAGEMTDLGRSAVRSERSTEKFHGTSSGDQPRSPAGHEGHDATTRLRGALPRMRSR